MKKILNFTLISLIILSTTPISFAEATESEPLSDTESTQETTTETVDFSDVTSNTPYYDAIQYVKKEGIVNGYPDGTYQPEKVINRAEFTKIIMEANVDPSLFDLCERIDTFTDVLDSDWFAPYICMAHTNDIIDGYSETSFKPNDPVKFVEAAKIIVKGFSYELETFEGNDWYKPFMIELEKRNVIPTSIRDLENQVTRGEMAHLIYTLKENINDRESSHFYTFSDGKYSKIDGGVQTFIMNTSVKLGEPIEITLDNSDPDGQKAMYDFDTGTLGGNDVTPDFYLFEHFFENQWMHSSDWNVVKMGTSFEETKECPSNGYSSILNDNGDGTGTPADPYTGDIFCLQTSEGNFVLLEVLDAGNDGDDIQVTLKYLIQPDGGRTFHE